LREPTVRNHCVVLNRKISVLTEKGRIRGRPTPAFALTTFT